MNIVEKLDLAIKLKEAGTAHVVNMAKETMTN